MKKNIVLLSLLIAGIGLYAQEIDLSKFKLPEYKRNALEFNLSSSNNGIISHSGYIDSSAVLKEKQINLNNSALINYTRYSNTRNYQGYLRSDLDVGFPGFGNFVSTFPDLKTSSNRHNSSINFGFYSANRFFSESKWFAELNPDISLNSRSFNQSNEDRFGNPVQNNTAEYKISGNSLNIASEFRVGKGRIEPVEDLRQVIYILEDLKKAGRLKREITQEESMALAEKLSAIKNRRFLDSRLRLIEEMTEIEKIMTEMDLITDNDALFFSTVNDYWSMTNNPSRLSGNSFSFGIRPAYFSSDNKSSDKITKFNPDTIYINQMHVGRSGSSLNFTTRYNNYKPLNLKWQQELSGEISAEMANSREKDMISNSDSTNSWIDAGFNGGYRLVYYASSRTNYSGNIGFSYTERFTGNSAAEPGITVYKYLDLGFRFNAVYYFSPQLTLQGSSGLSYSNRQDLELVLYPEKKNKLLLNLNVSLVYKLF